ncbi:MAG TPA: hypothetical protein VF329_12400 [Gammaproteobacteria bacterium]
MKERFLTSARRFLIASIGLAGLAACETQRVGQSATVQFGIVRAAEEVTLDSAATQGAVIGGKLGLLTGGNRSNVSNAIRGAAIGAAAGAASDGGRRGMAYTVDLTDGSSARIVTDQREIMPGDCVAIERVRDTANIRRKSQSYCDRASQDAVRAIQVMVRSDAAECRSAKQELVEARTEEEVDLASRKVDLLCNG